MHTTREVSAMKASWNFFINLLEPGGDLFHVSLVVAGTCMTLLCSLLWLFCKNPFSSSSQLKDEDDDSWPLSNKCETNGNGSNSGSSNLDSTMGEDIFDDEEDEERKPLISAELKNEDESVEELEESAKVEAEEEGEETNGFLPDEIYFEIFSYLRAEEMEPLSLISKNWKRVVEDSLQKYNELCDEEEVPIKEKVQGLFQPGTNWKTKYFITARYISADRTEKWQHLLDSLMEGATHGFITDHEMHVIVMSPKLKLQVADLDDIFKGVGVKGKYPVPIILRIAKGTYTVLSSTSNYYNGLSIVARDLNVSITSTGLVIVKTKKLVLVVLKERCYYFDQIAVLQTVFRVSEHLLEQGY